MEELKKRIQAIQEEAIAKIKEAAQEIAEEKIQFPKGWSWIEIKSHGDRFTFLALNPHLKDGMIMKDAGISKRYGSWETEKTALCDASELVTHYKATEEEIKEALVREAEKRGFKDGLTIDYNGLNGWNMTNILKDGSFGYKYNINDDCLYFGGGHTLVYNYGKWAEVVKKEPITICGYEVKFFPAGKYPESIGSYYEAHTVIDGHSFTKSFWEAAKTVSEHTKAKIMIGFSKQFDESLETINKILDRLNS